MKGLRMLEKVLEAYKNGMSIERVCRNFGGFSIYIPKVPPNARENIIKEFNGYNYAFLAYKYNMSERSVRHIITKNKQKESERSLFDWQD